METFKEFYKKHKDKLFGYLLRLTGDYEFSRDIMQECFTRYFERYGDADLNVSLLFTIGRNAVLDEMRRRKRHSVMAAEKSTEADHQENRYLIREEYHRVLVAIQQLRIDERDLISMVVTSGLSYREIAGITGLSETNIKVKIHRVRLKLRAHLQAGES